MAPFCSTRCRLADLGRWLSEDYRVPSEGTDEPPDDPQTPVRARDSRRDDETDD